MIVDPAKVSGAMSYRLLTATVVPRPIGFISTVSADGIVNLAPFSFFNAFSGEPPIVAFAPGTRTPPKDTLVNVRATGEFVVNIVTEAIAEQMNLTSADYPPDVDEFVPVGLTAVPSDLVRPPRVAESPVNLECRVVQLVELSALPLGGTLVIGEVIRFHIDDRIMDGTRVDADKLRAVGRMSGHDYTRTRDRFQMIRPSAIP